MDNITKIAILIVDDDPVFRAYVCAVLEQGLEEVVCQEASSVLQANQLLSEHEFNLAILDVHLPDGTALNIIHEAGRTPCMLCTQDDKKPSFLKVFNDTSVSENIVGYIAKPLPPSAMTTIQAGLQVGRERMLRRKLVAEATSELEEERRAIGQNLHDAMGASLTRLTWIFNGIDRIVQSGADAKILVQEISDLCSQGLGVIHTAHSDVSGAITQLRPEIVSVAGLKSAIEYMVREWEQAAPNVHFECDLSSKLREVDPRKSGVLYRLAQEGLTNAMRHGNPLFIRIEINCSDTYVKLRVHSKGSVQELKTYPLTALRERTSSLGGLLKFDCNQLSGESNLLITIPLYL